MKQGKPLKIEIEHFLFLNFLDEHFNLPVQFRPSPW